MYKTLLYPPVLVTAIFSVAATVAIIMVIFMERPDANEPEPGPPGQEATLVPLDENGNPIKAGQPQDGDTQDPRNAQPSTDNAPTKLMAPMPLPEFEVTDHTGKTITKQSMLGRVWVCDFFLTRCKGICPLLGQTMSQVAGKVAADAALEGVLLISFSVDPEHDTVEELQKYRATFIGSWSRPEGDKRKRAIQRFWVHARAAQREAFWKIVEGGFKLAVSDAPNDPKTPVSHSGKLVLVDKKGNIRGYYDGLTDADLPTLLADIRRLVREDG